MNYSTTLLWVQPASLHTLELPARERRTVAPRVNARSMLRWRALRATRSCARSRDGWRRDARALCGRRLRDRRSTVAHTDRTTCRAFSSRSAPSDCDINDADGGLETRALLGDSRFALVRLLRRTLSSYKQYVLCIILVYHNYSA